MGKKSNTKARYLDLNPGSSSALPSRFTPARFRPDTELEILRILKRAAADKNLQGIFINTSGLSADRAYLWELQNALEVCRASGKKIVAYFDDADFNLYCLLSFADKIVMDEGAALSFLGLSWGRFFAKETLEKAGIGFRELRYLEYKSANETFTRTTISEADREQYGAYLDDVFNLTKETILKNRSLNEEDFNALLKEGFLLSPQEALRRSLVDALGREDAIREIIQKLEFPENPAESSAELTIESSEAKAGANITDSSSQDKPPDTEEGTLSFVSAGDPSLSLLNHGRQVPRYTSGKTRKIGAKEIAVIHARGNTDLEQGMEARNIAKIIRVLGEKSSVKALIIRIDSPGGSAVAADYINTAIQKVKAKMPVVVSLGQTAASGGYWAAMNGSHINASPYTLTGSIGVIGGWFFDRGLDAKLGLGIETLNKGEHADLPAGVILPRRDLSEDEEKLYQRCILDLYADFVRKAALGRNMKDEELEPLARGRVYSGKRALELKLVDSLGGYLEALETARNLAKIPPSKKILIREYPKLKFIESMAQRIFSSNLEGVPDLPGYLGFPLKRKIASPLWEDLKYRLSHNGQAMPLLPCGILVSPP